MRFKWGLLSDGATLAHESRIRTEKKQIKKRRMSTVCSNCGGTDIEYDQARGDAVCTSCGSVLEDNIIVSEVTFQEQSSGASTVIGQFVSADGGKAPLSGTGFHHGMGKDSREVTLQQAKKRLVHLGNMLKLNQHCIDTAFTFFKMALQMNLTRGRKSSIIDTACLYLVCRSEGTPHLLLDFSDVLQINVYALGRAYLKLSNALHINPPAIDPCLYIHRFAHKLELGDKTHEVSMTALRLVARMKRDWIHHGRRPAGLCGAALLVAARLHNFNRSVKEMARVVKLSEGTIRKRLGDFKDTASSRLTIEEFLKIDLEQEHDPPSFTEAKRKAKQVSTVDAMGDSDESDDDVIDIDEENAEEGLESGGGGFGGIKMSSVQDIIAKARIVEEFMSSRTTAGLSDNLEELAKLVEEGDDENAVIPAKLEGGCLDLEDIDDEEIEEMLLSEEEVKIKTQLWFAENGDYLKEQEERREKLAAMKTKGEKPKRRSRRKQRSQHNTPASSAGEAIERMLVEKRISSKINYDVLRDLDKGLTADSSSTPAVSDNRTVEPVTPTGFPGFGSSLPTVDHSSLAISKPPPTGGGRLPSLTTRKRTFSSLGEGATALFGSPSKISRIQPSTSLLPSPQVSTAGPVQESSLVKHLRTAQRTGEGVQPEVAERTSNLQDTEETRTKSATDTSGGAATTSTDERKGPAGEPEVVEESGPVEYSDEEEGLDDEEMDELAYEGDPLLDSDFEVEKDVDDY